MATTGKATFIFNNQTYYTWYTITGELQKSKRRPLIAVHGGPGMSHDYMLPNQKLFELAGIPVVLYDQIGNGQSTRVDDAPSSFWTLDLFMDELENLVKHLGIANDYDLLGQSWGGMLAGNFAAARRPAGLKHLIIANAPASMPEAMAGLHHLLKAFSEEDREIIRRCEADNTPKAEEYQRVVMDFMKKHICSLDPWPAELQASFAAVEACPTVSNAMLGPFVFTNIGNMKDWSIIDILHHINVPTLLLSSPLDEVQENAYHPWLQKIPTIQWAEIKESTHLAQFEAPERYYEAVLGFLNGFPQRG